MLLPDRFLDNMKKLLPEEEYDTFLASYEDDRFFGLRVNTLKAGPEELPLLCGEEIHLGKRIPWCGSGYYYTDSQPGRLPLYHAGVYYIQEPSAMYPGGSVPLKEGANVLDICAAPGGKSTQLAARMAGKGLLVSNDISEERTKALVKNLQMAGVTNGVVTNETPENLAKRFPEFFDVIVVDAPCSGEGMFRKDEEAVRQWESFKSDRCREMQDEILESVDRMLKPGGVLSYSTCTFAPLENEDTIAAFLENHPRYTVLETPKVGGVADGFAREGREDLSRTARLWPHKVEGEGHFTAFLQKEGDPEELPEEPEKGGKQKKKNKVSSYRLYQDIPAEIRDYFESYTQTEAPEGYYFSMEKNYYWLPVPPPNMDGLKIQMAGVFLGQILHGEYKMSHQMALTMRPEDFAYEVALEADCDAVGRYLKGETLMVADRGVHVFAFGEEASPEAVAEENLCGPCCVSVAVGDRRFVLGLGAISGATVKNQYPKGWRRFQ